MVVSGWHQGRRAPRAKGLALGMLLASALLGAPSTAHAERPASPASEGELPPPPPPPTGAVDNGAVTPPPASPAADPPVATPPPSPEPYAAPPEPYAPPPDPYVPAKHGPHPRRWYGWQTLATDAAAVAMLTTAIVWAANNPLGGDDSPVVGLLGASYATYVLGAPIIHFAHGSGKKGFGDLALRLFGPPLVGAVGAVFCTAVCSDGGGGDFGDLRPLVGFVFGTMAGLIAVPIVDAAAIAYDPAEPGTALVAPRQAKLTLSWVPNVEIRRHHGLLLGVRGGF